MEFLYLLEKIRNPFFDWFFSFITNFGDETVFLILGLFLFWCIDKYFGYYLIGVGLTGTLLNQTLKVMFRVPRPWVIDSNFKPVGNSIETAGGYSFPSGHTQFSVGTFGGIVRYNKIKWVRIVAIVMCVLVPFSRMYLGVHTPLDVGVSVVCALALVFAFYPIFEKAKEDKRVLPIFFGSLIVLIILGLLFMYLYNFPKGVDSENLLSGQKSLWKLLGTTIGILCGYFVDIKITNFETKGNVLTQIVKLLVGLLIVLGLKEGLRPLLKLIFNGNVVADCIRYAIMVFFAVGIWPMTFKWLNKICNKKSK